MVYVVLWRVEFMALKESRHIMRRVTRENLRIYISILGFRRVCCPYQMGGSSKCTWLLLGRSAPISRLDTDIVFLYHIATTFPFQIDCGAPNYEIVRSSGENARKDREERRGKREQREKEEQ